MNRITLAMLLAAAVCVPRVGAVAVAQDPTPPVRPAPAPAPRAEPAPVRTPRPAVAPRAARYLDDDTQMAIDDAMLAARDAMANNRDLINSTREATRAAMEDARASLAMARDFAPLADLSDLRISIPPMPAMPAIAVGNIDIGFGRSIGEGFSVHTPPAAWAQGDPADSVYRSARDALIKGDYGRAAKMFADIQKSFPKSAYAGESQYYEAYARYKIGTTEELQTAARVLEPLATRTMNVSNVSNTATGGNRVFYDSGRRGASDNEVATLYARINGVLAQRGDRAAAEKVAKAASLNGPVCDNEDIQVRVEAMNALSQMDPAAAMPLLKRVLDRKDACSAELRRRAVFMLGRRSDAESSQLLIAAAKSDASPDVRIEAINALPRLPGDAGLNALEEMLRTEQDERIQRAVVRSLTSSDNARARSSMRALIDRKDAPLALRVEAINSFNSDRATTDDAAYLRALYTRADNDRIKDAVINAVSRMGGAENDRWVLGIAQNANEPSQLRAAAISRLMRSNISIADLSKLYDTSESLSIRQQIVSVLANRKEPEATDKLIDIVKNSTVVNVRAQAINALVRKNDPRGIKLLNDLLDGKAP